MIVDIIHPNSATPKKSEVRDALAKNYKTTADCIIAFGYKTIFGGGKTSGFALIYDSVEAAKKVEPRYRNAVIRFKIIMVRVVMITQCPTGAVFTVALFIVEYVLSINFFLSIHLFDE